jgi:N-acetylglucosaminyl-diphospho-decaprenol L-rhamnosyltransferase
VTDSPATVPTADVVVVTYNPGETIGTFLASVPKASASLGSVTVVDNASRDDTPQQAAADAGVGFVQTGRNAGYGTAANAGAQQGKAPWILISNADIVLGEGAIDALVAAGEADPGVGALGPLVRERDGSVYPSARPLPRLVTGAAHAILSRAWPKNPWTRRYLVPLDPAKGPRHVEWLSGSCFLVRRQAWDAVGGLPHAVDPFRRGGTRGRTHVAKRPCAHAEGAP